jgi:glycosyltransferase involved in cell wall biosynthesis
MSHLLKNTLVSVIMPAYNRGNTLPASIQSVIDQSYQNWELLVVDDRSNDRTKEIIENFSNKDHRIKYLRNKYSQGPGGARNFGIDNADGKYLSFLDSDDLWLSHHLADSITILEKENLPFCSAKWFEKKDDKTVPSIFANDINYLANRFRSKKMGSNYYIFDATICEFILVNNMYPFHISTVIIEKTALQNIGKFDESLFGPEDSDLIFRIALIYGLCIIDSFHSVWIQGDDNIHFFKENTCQFDKISLPKINKNRLNHLKFFKKQKRVILKHKEQFSDYKYVLQLKNYELLRNSMYISKLNKNRNILLYIKMIWNIWYYYTITHGSILRNDAYRFANRNRPRVLLENVPRVEINEVLMKCSELQEPLLQQISAKRKNYWLYFEKDIRFEIRNNELCLYNYKTKQKLIFHDILNELDNLTGKHILINYVRLQNKKLLNFILKINKNDFGGLIDITSTGENPVPLLSESLTSSIWV